ncbi:MAG: hypothetical protein ALECFALPRED_002881 [Alectoria fallacina]|uniref:PDZ GRASP-type domain-containing protein n=1 Tax=Alectoria fallacina TaxID=1903189 RepID=A0A8H3IL76_9LECA|nr:MAG: hypothetical protein ALECFALPRED_002881 [Alectoria fallacina]
MSSPSLYEFDRLQLQASFSPYQNMFGALNRFISRLDSDAPSPTSRDSHAAFGFQVLRNKNDDIPIEPWYDFVIGINGRRIEEPDTHSFAVEIRNCAGSNVALTIWSAKGQRVRTCQVAVPTPSPTLGLTLQWTPISSTEDVWHILDVIPGSPADIAGLLPYGDYIVGTPEGNVRGEAGLGELVEDYLSRTLRLWVYNHEYAVTRLVTITPSRSWGGSGALGCVLGFGALHRLPAPLNEPPAGPGETLFETARFSNEQNRPSSALLRSHPSGSSLYKISSNQQSGDLLVPATLTSPPPPLPMGATAPGPPRAARKVRKAVSPNSAFDEYFKEGEQKSKEEDFTPAAKSVPPPPPKMGGPPPGKSPEPEADSRVEEAAS